METTTATKTTSWYIRLSDTHAVGPFQSEGEAREWSTTPLPAGTLYSEEV